ncbi:hypothetical protein GOQ27_13945 [Clostridium sp. D2Q-11]|uniref:Uncharacterized protein n=1 Tax=Anaeromonas frigoriresistens TaxID=2683708 RepID=A0A942Z8A0_9FIRM|nr:hypothetical protein [Anaeromonas frigoriresistens]MBS4539572.1 hypothetical protein [Anaeromonas frigoriresistens]
MFNINDKNFIGYKIGIPLLPILSIIILFSIGVRYAGTQYQNILLTLALFSQLLFMLLIGIRLIKIYKKKGAYINIIVSVILIAFLLYFYVSKLS